MLQIVHDVAPGASLSFASAFNGQASFAANIQALKAAGAKVIVDDAIYLAEPFFQDGIIAQAVDNVVASGSAYFSAAGNNDRQSYQSAFRPGDSFADGAIPSGPSAPHFFGGIAHNFNSSGGKDQFQSITIPGRATVTFILQWDSPFFSVSGAPGTQNDVDMYILNSSATQILAGTAFSNIGGDAVEIFSFTNNAMTPVTVNIMIVKFSGANPGLIKYIRMGSATVNEYDTQSGTIFGHANAAAAEAVGAVAYFNTPAFGVAPPVLESYSSSGTTPILFDLSGNRLPAPDPRADKPEISAPDGVDTTFFGTDTDGDGFPNFFGTSAAAPHAGALAALLLQFKPTATPGKIYTSLERSAIDMGAPGFDNDSGFGLVQAAAAIAAVLKQTVVDFDGDGKSDIGFYRDGLWSILRSSDGGNTVVGLGNSSQIPVPADYDGDGITDEAVYSNGVWSIVRSSDGATMVVSWGGPGFVPVPADYDGDGKADIAVYNPIGVWSILRSSDGGTTLVGWGGPGFIPVPADYDGDGKADIAVYHPIGVWSIVRSSDGGNTLVGWGGPSFIPVPADYDGDGKADIAVYHPIGVWSVVRSSDGGNTLVGWGGPSFTPVPADYDGDGKADIAVYHPTGVWSIVRSSDGGNTLVGWGGAPQDIPLN
jgi:Subtilase family